MRDHMLQAPGFIPDLLRLDTCVNIRYQHQGFIPDFFRLEKWFPLRGERAHCLKLFCMYDKRFEISKTNRMEEETEPQT